jgi:Tfp pilus assembly protein PilZ
MMSGEKVRTLRLPRDLERQWRIEAPGCVIWIRPTVGKRGLQGSAIGVECDGDRYGERQRAQVQVGTGAFVTTSQGYVKILIEPD